jgi:hypothetical protein
MAMTTSRSIRIFARMKSIELQLNAIDEAMMTQLSEGKGFMLSYKFDSGHGKQEVVYTRMTDINNLTFRLNAELSRLERMANNAGLHPVVFRRKF